jgi:hypothetical protein
MTYGSGGIAPLEGVECVASLFGSLTPGQRTPGGRRMGVWLVPVAQSIRLSVALDAFAE